MIATKLIRSGVFCNAIKNVRSNVLRSTAITQQKRSYYMYSPEPFHPIPNKYPEWKSVEDALSVVTSGMWNF